MSTISSNTRFASKYLAENQCSNGASDAFPFTGKGLLIRFGPASTLAIWSSWQKEVDHRIMAQRQEEKKVGLTIVYTGDGKGKTTAALGMCVRAAGYKWKVKILQFVKGSWKYGELKGIKLLADYVEMEQVGEGFVGIVDDDKDFSVHREAARRGLAYAREIVGSGKYDLVILDELNVALDLGLVDLSEVLDLIAAKPEKLHLVITGRGAKPEVIEVANLVTEMTEIKHPYRQGILAQRGVDW
ncbi:MAG: cob(I)yrinic acid a,c-diamide adenosyltransferase [bacterium]